MANTEPLYPPIVDTAVPIFIYREGEETANIYFDLSPYQSHSGVDFNEQDAGDNTYYFWGGRSGEPTRPLILNGQYPPFYNKNTSIGYTDASCNSTYSLQVVANTQLHNSSVFNPADFPQEIAAHMIAFRNNSNKNDWNYNLLSYSIQGVEVNNGEGWLPGQYYRTQARLMKDPFSWGGVEIEIIDPDTHELILPDIRNLFGTVYTEIAEASDDNCTYQGNEQYGFRKMCEKYLVESFKTVCKAAYDRGEWPDGVSPITLLRQAVTKRRELIDWYEENNFVSEWSTICMVRSIYEPLWIINAKDMRYSGVNELNFKSPLINLQGQLEIPEDGLEPETLSSIQVTVYRMVNNQPVEIVERANIIPNTQNVFNSFSYKLKHMLAASQTYRINISVETRNGWRSTIMIHPNIEQIADELDNISLACIEDNPRGCIDMVISTDPAFESVYNYAIIRSDNPDQNQWEDICILEIPDGEHTITLYDTTAESGTQYRYGLQQIDKNTGTRGNVWILDENGNFQKPGTEGLRPLVLIPFYEDMFLSNADDTLAISYGQALTSYKTNIKEASIETIGSPYPFYYRNEVVNYRTVQLSGTISYNDNNEERLFSIDATEGTPYSSRMGQDATAHSSPESFANNNLIADNFNKGFRAREDLFGQRRIENYADFNSKNRINNMNDITLEREYRKEVIKFLQDGKPKLLKTAAEGNMLVILMNITFTPKTEINNIVYDFTCDAMEIDECSISNYNKYNIQYLKQHNDDIHVYPYQAITTEVGTI